MPERTKIYRRVLYAGDIVRESFRIYVDRIGPEKAKALDGVISFEKGDERLSNLTVSEFERYDGFQGDQYWFEQNAREVGFRIYKNRYTIEVSARLPNLSNIDEILFPFARDHEKSRLTVDQILAAEAKVFIGHGRSPLWRDLKDHLHEKHGIEVIAYETGARAGYNIQEVLEDMTSASSMAFLVLTAEDVDRDGLAHARENVVHETGLAQGKLGFKRAIVLLEDGCTEFSNISGLQQIRFSKGNVREVFGEVLAVIRRELGKS